MTCGSGLNTFFIHDGDALMITSRMKQVKRWQLPSRASSVLPFFLSSLLPSFLPLPSDFPLLSVPPLSARSSGGRLCPHALCLHGQHADVSAAHGAISFPLPPLCSVPFPSWMRSGLMGPLCSWLLPQQSPHAVVAASGAAQGTAFVEESAEAEDLHPLRVQ